MNFSNKFKIWWWAILLAVLTGVSAGRFFAGTFNNFDNFIFIFWFILVLFPIISEISIFGVSVKKEVEEIKREIESQFFQLKNEIKNHNQMTVNIFDKKPEKIKSEEYLKEKREELIAESPSEEKEESDKKGKIFSVSEAEEQNKKSSNPKVKERLEKLIFVENLVHDLLRQECGDNYKAQLKFEDKEIDRKLIVDGVVYNKEGQVIEIIEIKFIRNFDTFYYVAMNWAGKVVRLGLRIPVRFIIISEEMDSYRATELREKITYMNSCRIINKSFPKILFRFFKLKNDKLIEIKLPKNE